MFQKFSARFDLKNRYPIVILVLLPLIVFYKATFGTDIFALGDFTGSDLLEMHLPSKYILHDAYTKGEFPLWTSYLSNGFPILAEGQSGPLYLPHVVFAFLPPFLALNYSILLPMIVAGVGAFVFAQRLPKMSVFGAFSCGLIFMFCSFFIARLKHINMIAVAAYLPWCMWIISKSLEHTSERVYKVNLLWFVLLGCIWALQIYAGHPHMFYFCVIMTAWYAIGEVLRIWIFNKPNNLWGIIASGVTGFFVTGLLAIGLSAAQLLPTIELTQLSSRLQYNFETATSFPLRPSFLVTLFAPFFLGNPATGGYRGNISVDGIWWENVMYIGLLPFILFVVTLIFRLKKILGLLLFSTKRLGNRLRTYLSEDLYYYWFFVISALIFFLLSCGDFTGLFSILYYNVPGMQLFRFPTRFNLFTLFSLAVVTGYSLDRAISRLEKSRHDGELKRSDSSDYVFSWPFSKVLTKVLVTLVITVDLIVFAYQYVGFFPVEKYLITPASVTDLRKDASDYRIYPITQYSQNPFKELGWKSQSEAIYSLQTAIPGNFAAVYRLASFTDRGWFEGGLGVSARHRLEKTLLDNSISPSLLSKILGMWNVKYMIGFNDLEDPSFTDFASYTLDKSFELPLTILENKFVLPRAYFTNQLKKVDTENLLLESLFSETFSPEFEGLTTDAVPDRIVVPVSDSDFKLDDFRAKNVANITQSSALHTVIEATTEKGGYLILTDTYYPGWKAYIDGINSPVYQVNLVQRAVYVDEGSHTVIWVYEPFMFYVGLCVSIASLVCCICIGLFAFRKKGSAGRGMQEKLI